MESSITGAVAAILTLLDLDRTFHVPSGLERKLKLYAWWFGFIVANGLLAALLYSIVGSRDPFTSIDPLVRPLVIGLGYLTLVRTKFFTIRNQDQDLAIGLEPLYEGIRSAVYRRINAIVKSALTEEIRIMTQSRTLVDLANSVRNDITHDALMSSNQKDAAKLWLLGVLEDKKVPTNDKREILANFLVSGNKTQPFHMNVSPEPDELAVTGVLAGATDPATADTH